MAVTPPTPDPDYARSFRDAMQTHRIKETAPGRRSHPVPLNADPCVYCGLKATLGDPPTCWEHRDDPTVDRNYGATL